MSNNVQEQIDQQVKSSPIVMYTKGTKGMPQCGFSKLVMDIFDELGVDYTAVDVLSEPGVRDGIKEYTSWPTIPQIFINGEFIGGCDIVRDLYMKGELEKMVKAALQK